MKTNIQELVIEGITYVPKNSIQSKVVELNGDESVWEVGKNYLIRTVTMIQVGKLEKVTDKELLLSTASWVADTGLFTTALKDGVLNEVEIFNKPAIVGRGGIIDATEWVHELPTERK